MFEMRGPTTLEFVTQTANAIYFAYQSGARDTRITNMGPATVFLAVGNQNVVLDIPDNFSDGFALPLANGQSVTMNLGALYCNIGTASGNANVIFTSGNEY